MTRCSHILLVEDEQDIATQVVDYLSQQGLIVDYACNGKIALSLLEKNHYDVVVLDLMLPDIDGLSLCHQIKSSSDVNLPVLMLTARDSMADKVHGFEMGADDYLTKPFILQEVYLRCQALSRRHLLHSSNKIIIGDLIIDVKARSVTRQNTKISLSVTDFELLTLLAQAYPNALSKRHLTEKIWGDFAPESDAIRSHIYTLRNAVDKPFSAPMIRTVHGIGFKLELTT